MTFIYLFIRYPAGIARRFRSSQVHRIIMNSHLFLASTTHHLVPLFSCPRLVPIYSAVYILCMVYFNAMSQSCIHMLFIYVGVGWGVVRCAIIIMLRVLKLEKLQHRQHNLLFWKITTQHHPTHCIPDHIIHHPAILSKDLHLDKIPSLNPPRIPRHLNRKRHTHKFTTKPHWITSPQTHSQDSS